MSIKSFYKFQPIFDESKLDEEYSIINLASKQVVFSTRKSFNDIFDTKLNLIRPSKSDLDSIYQSLSGQEKFEFKNKHISKNTKTPLEDVEKALNKRIDTYLFYCVTDNCMNNLMWGHYASSHKGFCIEWDASKILAKKVNYKKRIASLDIIDFIKPEFLVNSIELQEKIINAFSTKLLEWSYESEYRFHLSDNLAPIKANSSHFQLVTYEQRWIKSIIWGCRTSEKVKHHIKKILPDNMVYKQAKEGESSIYVD